MRNKPAKPALVTDPYTGKTYDISPFFQYLNEQNIKSPKALARSMERLADLVPHLIEETSDAIMDMQNVHFNFLELKSVFRRIEER